MLAERDVSRGNSPTISPLVHIFHYSEELLTATVGLLNLCEWGQIEPWKHVLLVSSDYKVMLFKRYPVKRISSLNPQLFMSHTLSEPTKPSQPHSFNYTPTTMCTGSNSLHCCNGFVYDATAQPVFGLQANHKNNSLSPPNKTLLNFYFLYLAWLQPTSLPLTAIAMSGVVLMNGCFPLSVVSEMSKLVTFSSCVTHVKYRVLKWKATGSEQIVILFQSFLY